jgi:hypothetical protein
MRLALCFVCLRMQGRADSGWCSFWVDQVVASSYWSHDLGTTCGLTVASSRCDGSSRREAVWMVLLCWQLVDRMGLLGWRLEGGLILLGCRRCHQMLEGLPRLCSGVAQACIARCCVSQVNLKLQ